jgi:hypothetical protein
MTTENKMPIITIDEVEYDSATFTDTQKLYLNHIADLDNKINQARFQLDQLTVGKEAFINMLKQSLRE